MPRKRHKPEEIVAKLRQVHFDILVLLAIVDHEHGLGGVADRVRIAVPRQQQFAIGTFHAQL